MLRIPFKDVINYSLWIHCVTEAQAKKLLYEAHKIGLKWSNGTSYMANSHFKAYEDQTIYNVTNGYYLECTSNQYSFDFDRIVFDDEVSEHMIDKPEDKSVNRICFDVDGTLITFEDTPRYDVINLLLFFVKNKDEVYIWSGGGIDYAERWAHRLGLQIPVIEKGSIVPDLCFDDEVVSLAKVNVRV